MVDVNNINCPNCGGQIPTYSAATAISHCPYCGSLVVLNEKALEVKGKMSLLTDTPSCLGVGWTARCLNREIVTIGRIQLQYDAGLWDEWWIKFIDDGSEAWISQDEGEFMLEIPLKSSGGLPEYKDLNPGDQLKIDGSQVWVEEHNEAQIVGFQGSLPFTIEPDEVMYYVDFTDGKLKATAEFFADGHKEIFKGQYLGPKDLISLAR